MMVLISDASLVDNSVVYLGDKKVEQKVDIQDVNQVDLMVDLMVDELVAEEVALKVAKWVTLPVEEKVSKSVYL